MLEVMAWTTMGEFSHETTIRMGDAMEGISPIRTNNMRAIFAKDQGR